MQYELTCSYDGCLYLIYNSNERIIILLKVSQHVKSTNMPLHALSSQGKHIPFTY